MFLARLRYYFAVYKDIFIYNASFIKILRFYFTALQGALTTVLPAAAPCFSADELSPTPITNANSNTAEQARASPACIEYQANFKNAAVCLHFPFCHYVSICVCSSSLI